MNEDILEMLEEFDILSNTLITIVIQNGGHLVVPRDWGEFNQYTVMRQYDEELNADVFTLMGGTTRLQ